MAATGAETTRSTAPGSGTSRWHVRARRWLREHQWPIIGAAWLMALVIGFVGYARHFAALGEPRSGWDVLYRALQLFVLEGGQPSPGTIWEFELARFLAPVVTGYTALQGLALLFSEQLARLTARFARGHVVICGLGDKGLRLALGFRAQGHRVLAIESDPANPNVAACREQGVTVLTGDASMPEALNGANVASASYLFAVCGDDGVNAEIAVRARAAAVRRRSGVLGCYAHIVELALCRLLREQHLAGPHAEAFRLEFFNVYESGARALLAAHPVAAPDDRPAHVLIVGMGDLGEALVLQAAREWREAGAGGRLRIGVVDRMAQARVRSLLARCPHLADICDLVAHEMDVRSAEFETADFLVDGDGRCAVTAAFVCLSADALSITSALSLGRRLAGSADATIVARVAERGGLQTLLSECEGIVAFPLLDETCRPELLLRGVNETLAQAMHEDYLRHELARGAELGSRGALHRWEDLDEHYREANRAQADCLAERLAAFGYRIAPLTDWEAERFEFSADEIEGMARMEHERWCAERRGQGYRWGEVRDDRRKTHPDLVGWDELSEEGREKDRMMVRNLPGFLARAGFQVERAHPQRTTASSPTPPISDSTTT